MGRHAWIISPEKEQEILLHLERGIPIDQVADMLDLKEDTLRHYARKRLLPLNRPIPPRSHREALVCRAVVAGFSPKDIARFFKVAPCLIEEAVARVQEVGARPPERITP